MRVYVKFPGSLFYYWTLHFRFARLEIGIGAYKVVWVYDVYILCVHTIHYIWNIVSLSRENTFRCFGTFFVGNREEKSLIRFIGASLGWRRSPRSKFFLKCKKQSQAKVSDLLCLYLRYMMKEIFLSKSLVT